MAHGLKTSGLDTLADLKKRAIRQYALRRISKLDHDRLLEKFNEIEAYIVRMDELDPNIDNDDWKRII